MRSYVFWQNSVSLHQAPIIRALAARPNVRVSAFMLQDVPESRKRMGWTYPDYGLAQIRVQSSEVALEVDDLFDADVHIFSGVGAYKGLDYAFRQVQRRGAGLVLAATEPWDPRGLRGVFRRARAIARVTKASSSLSGLLLCGSYAGAQFRAAPWLRQIPTIPYGYFVDSSVDASSVNSDVNSEDGCNLIFVGELKARKDPLLMVRALARLRHLPWRLRIIGSGPLERPLEDEIERLGLGARVVLLGSQQYSATREAIRNSDLLILPSRFDGWGAVVNEALVDGTRVVVSDACGAQDIVVDSLLGRVFRAGSQVSLAEAITDVLSEEPTAGLRRTVRDWASRAISPDAIAEYLESVTEVNDLKHLTPPWRSIPVGRFEGDQ